SVIPIDIPPLRERTEDIIPLVYHILARELGDGKPTPEIDTEAQVALQQYPWPGNVRELENAVRHACTFAQEDKIALDVLPPQIVKGSLLTAQVEAAAGGQGSDDYKGQSLKAFLRAKEKDYLQTVLEHVEGDKVKAAETLKISLATLYRKLPEPIE
ncbi:MAG: helix-turn-helix domain-containing protein, partial [Verrucomicrobiota bacterium]